MEGRGRKVLIGCLIGCGSLLVLAVVAFAAGMYWVTRPGELLEPEQLLGDDSTGFVEWTLRLEDPGTEGFVELLGEALAAFNTSNPDMPPALRDWLPGVIGSETRSDLRELFPLALAWSMRPAEAEEDLHLFTVSLRQMGNQLRIADWMLSFGLSKDGDGHVVEHRDEKILMLDGHEGALFIRGNDIFVTSGIEMAKSAVDRLTGNERATGNAPLARFLREGDRPLSGAIDNTRGELARLWDVLAGLGEDGGLDFEPDLSAIAGMRLAGGLEPDGSLTCELVFVGPDEAWARSAEEGLAEALERLVSRLGPPVRVSGEAREATVRVQVTISDVIDYLRREVESEREAA